MKELPPGLNRKAEDVLRAYGGLKGLAKEPVWLIVEVLKAFFPEDEEKQILKCITREK